MNTEDINKIVEIVDGNQLQGVARLNEMRYALYGYFRKIKEILENNGHPSYSYEREIEVQNKTISVIKTYVKLVDKMQAISNSVPRT